MDDDALRVKALELAIAEQVLDPINLAQKYYEFFTAKKHKKAESAPMSAAQAREIYWAAAEAKAVADKMWKQTGKDPSKISGPASSLLEFLSAYGDLLRAEEREKASAAS